MISTLVDRFRPYALTILRVTAGFSFWQHGLAKFGFLEGTVREFPELRWFAGALEAFGGPLIMLGFFTRPVAFLLSGEMASAYFISHLPRGFWTVLNDGEPAYLFCFIFLFIVAAGPGKLSLDGWIAKKFGQRWWM